MMLATNWGVYEITKRHAEFIEDGDDRDMEIRTRLREHLTILRALFPDLSETFAITDGTADFPFRAFISRHDLSLLLASLPDVIDYVQFKKDAKDAKLHALLDRMWSAWLSAFPKHSKYDTVSRIRRTQTKNKRREWWDDL